MTTTKFIDALKNITQKSLDYLKNIQDKTLKWYLRKSRDALLSSSNETSTSVTSYIGKMIMFKYDPKHKKTLPYYDIYPLVFPIELYNDGFLGINLHYLPYHERAILMDALYSLMYNSETSSNSDRKNRLTIAYSILKNSMKFKNFRPCVKRYLYNHVQTKFATIPFEHWETVLFLPLHQFVKASDSYVWQQSMAAIRKRKP